MKALTKQTAKFQTKMVNIVLDDIFYLFNRRNMKSNIGDVEWSTTECKATFVANCTVEECSTLVDLFASKYVETEIGKEFLAKTRIDEEFTILVEKTDVVTITVSA